jgi:hypothetical protein
MTLLEAPNLIMTRPIDLVILDGCGKVFIGEYKSRTFKSKVGFILGIEFCCAIFAMDTNTPMCIFVVKCPTIEGLSSNYFG